MLNPATLSVDTISHALRRYMSYLAKKKQWPETHSLSMLIYDISGDPFCKKQLNKVSDISVRVMKEIADLTQSNGEVKEAFQKALIQACYQHGSHSTPDRANQTKYSPASMVAIFQKHTLNSAPYQPTYVVHLEAMSRLTEFNLNVMLYCIDIFKPSIRFVGDCTQSKKQIDITQQVIDRCNKAHFIFRTSNNQLIATGRREVFLGAVLKAKSLDINEAELERWTSDDFKHFLYAIECNPKLTSLKLSNTNLDAVCKDPLKFPYILKLMSLPQIKELDLSENHLEQLPAEEKALLEKAIQDNPDKQISLTYNAPSPAFFAKHHPTHTHHHHHTHPANTPSTQMRG